MADKAREWTDKHLRDMEKHLTQIYKKANKELTEKWDSYMASAQVRLENLHNAYVTAPASQKASALQKYQEALRNYTLKNKWYREMVDATTYRLAHVNEIALAYINDEIPKIYVANFNHIDPDALLVKSNWTLRNEQMVRNLIRSTLPQRTLNRTKDMAWNARQINNKILQGILQGESIPKIAKRLEQVIGNNRAATIRTARTMVTGAENRGRQDRYDEYAEEGLIMHKIWIATPDGHTRNWHLSMDGQEVRENETFIDGLGNELLYPGDPSAPANTVYNCRCSMRSHIVGVRGRDGHVKPIQDFGGSPFHDSQIAAEKARRRHGI